MVARGVVGVVAAGSGEGRGNGLEPTEFNHSPYALALLLPPPPLLPAAACARVLLLLLDDDDDDDAVEVEERGALVDGCVKRRMWSTISLRL
jgi:hypothetical protein